MVGAAIKGVSKILRKGLKKKPKVKSKPTPRYRTDTKIGERFLNRRATVSGVKKSKPSLTASAGVTLGLGLAGAAGYNIGKGKSTKDAKAKTAKLAQEAFEKDKKKKEKRKDN
jgi:hypothetical protein